MSVIQPKYIPHSILFLSGKASGFSNSSVGPYNLSTNNEEYLTLNNMAEMGSRWSDRTARLLTATSHYLISLPEWPKNWGQVNPYVDDYHSNLMEISSAF